MLPHRKQSLGDIRDGVVYISGGKIHIIFDIIVLTPHLSLQLQHCDLLSDRSGGF